MQQRPFSHIYLQLILHVTSDHNFILLFLHNILWLLKHVLLKNLDGNKSMIYAQKYPQSNDILYDSSV